MSRVADLNRRYAAAAELMKNGVELMAVFDPLGSRVNRVVRQIAKAAAEDGSELWESVVSPAKALRWRLVCKPQPLDFNPGLTEAAAMVASQVQTLRGALRPENAKLLDELAHAAEAVVTQNPAVGAVLETSIAEVGDANCVVVVEGSSAQAELSAWLDPLGVRVFTPGEIGRADVDADVVAYVVGPPSFYPPSLVTAPATSELAYLLPEWFGDRSIPRSAIADYAVGAIRIKANVHVGGGDAIEPELAAADEDPETEEPETPEEFLPQPVWGQRKLVDREPGADEVMAHKVLLSGGLAIWMDDGDRIRTLEPSQPAGERVASTEITDVRPGTYLVLRMGYTESSVLYDATLKLMGGRADAVATSQAQWKLELANRIAKHGYRAVLAELRKRGVRAADRARAWTHPTLARPQHDASFAELIDWLSLPLQPTFGNATDFRRFRSRAAQQIREQLETAIDQADLTALRRDGYVYLDRTGYAGIIATRVLAISPHAEIVSRQHAREPFKDEGGQWLG